MWWHPPTDARTPYEYKWVQVLCMLCCRMGVEIRGGRRRQRQRQKGGMRGGCLSPARGSCILKMHYFGVFLVEYYFVLLFCAYQQNVLALFAACFWQSTMHKPKCFHIIAAGGMYYYLRFIKAGVWQNGVWKERERESEVQRDENDTYYQFTSTKQFKMHRATTPSKSPCSSTELQPIISIIGFWDICIKCFQWFSSILSHSCQPVYRNLTANMD